MFPCKKNTAFTFKMALVSKADKSVLQLNPTLATGDVKVKVDSGSYANIATLPTATSGQPNVVVGLTSSEMNGDNISVWFKDAAGDEWCESIVELQTNVASVDDIKTDTNLLNGTLDVNMTQIAGDTSAATKFKYMCGTILSGTVATSGSNSATSFKTDLTETTNDFYGDSNGGAICAFIDDDNAVQARRISAYNGTTKVITVASAFATTPADGDRFIVTGHIDLG